MTIRWFPVFFLLILSTGSQANHVLKFSNGTGNPAPINGHVSSDMISQRTNLNDGNSTTGNQTVLSSDVNDVNQVKSQINKSISVESRGLFSDVSSALVGIIPNKNPLESLFSKTENSTNGPIVKNDPTSENSTNGKIVKSDPRNKNSLGIGTIGDREEEKDKKKVIDVKLIKDEENNVTTPKNQEISNKTSSSGKDLVIPIITKEKTTSKSLNNPQSVSAANDDKNVTKPDFRILGIHQNDKINHVGPEVQEIMKKLDYFSGNRRDSIIKKIHRLLGQNFSLDDDEDDYEDDEDDDEVDRFGGFRGCCGCCCHGESGMKKRRKKNRIKRLNQEKKHEEPHFAATNMRRTISGSPENFTERTGKMNEEDKIAEKITREEPTTTTTEATTTTTMETITHSTTKNHPTSKKNHLKKRPNVSGTKRVKKCKRKNKKKKADENLPEIRMNFENIRNDAINHDDENDDDFGEPITDIFES